MRERRMITRLGLAGGAMILAGGTAAGWAIHDSIQTNELYQKEKQQYTTITETHQQKQKIEADAKIATAGIATAIIGGLVLHADIYLSKNLRTREKNIQSHNPKNSIPESNYDKIREQSRGKAIDTVIINEDYL